MEQVNTMEGNKIIAKFRGWTPVLTKGEIVGWFNENDIMIILGEYEPHKNWEELMPVVEGVEKTDFIVDICGLNCRIYTDPSINNFEVDVQSELKIKSTWLAIIQWLTWYNSLTDKKPNT